MKIDRVDLWAVELPLVRPFSTSSSTRASVRHVVLRVHAEGLTGWGECSAPVDPYYCPETTGTCWHMLTEFLVPAVLGREWPNLDELTGLYRRVKGNGFARGGLELACADLLAKSRGQSLASSFGATRTEVESGVSLGIERDLGKTFEQIDQYREKGYKRIKLKIAPGHDVGPVWAVRKKYGDDLPLQVDANSAYGVGDVETLKELDEFGLLLIEQPLAHDDILDHAMLQPLLRTPICLDESVHSAEDARKALDFGACRVVNVKMGRVGGPSEALRVHHHCRGRGVPVWCGGMHEFGIGRAANLALAALPGFTLPGDVSGSDKYYREDLVEPPIVASSGRVKVPTGPGLGHEPIVERVERNALARWSTSN